MPAVGNTSQHLSSPLVSSECHGIPMAEPQAAFSHLMFSFQLRMTAMAMGSHILSMFFAFFTDVPVCSYIGRYLTAWLPDSVGKPCLCSQPQK